MLNSFENYLVLIVLVLFLVVFASFFGRILVLELLVEELLVKGLVADDAALILMVLAFIPIKISPLNKVFQVLPRARFDQIQLVGNWLTLARSDYVVKILENVFKFRLSILALFLRALVSLQDFVLKLFSLIAFDNFCQGLK